MQGLLKEEIHVDKREILRRVIFRWHNVEHCSGNIEKYSSPTEFLISVWGKYF